MRALQNSRLLGRHWLPLRAWPFEQISAWVMVPLILVVADVAADRTALKFLLLPPLGALTYLVFVNPLNLEVNIRRVIVCPTLTALLAWIIAGTLGYGAISVVLVVVGTMLIMWATRALMVVPPLALALLTILLHQEVAGHVDYVISVFVFTVAIYAIYRVWKALVIQA